MVGGIMSDRQLNGKNQLRRRYRRNGNTPKGKMVYLLVILGIALAVTVVSCMGRPVTTLPVPITLTPAVPSSKITPPPTFTPVSQDSSSTSVAVEENPTKEGPETPVLVTLEMEQTMTDSQCLIRQGQPLSEVETVVMPPVDVQALVAEDEQRPKDEPLRFAQPIAVQLNPATVGTWETLDNDILLWRLRLISSGAVSLSLGFTSYFMPPGGCLFLYTPDYSTVVGPFTDQDNEEHRQLWTPILMGDDIVVEVSLPASMLSQLELELTSVNHGYK
jgi:hypothetical protein